MEHKKYLLQTTHDEGIQEWIIEMKLDWISDNLEFDFKLLYPMNDKTNSDNWKSFIDNQIVNYSSRHGMIRKHSFIISDSNDLKINIIGGLIEEIDGEYNYNLKYEKLDK